MSLSKLEDKVTYYVAIGSPKNHSGLECEIGHELQIGDYVEMWHSDNEDEANGELVIVKSRFYATNDHSMIFYCERVL
jgi:hypothetical protein